MPKTKTPLTERQKSDFTKASNRVSIESLRYAADICGYTPLVKKTLAVLEEIVKGRSAFGDCRQLQTEAAKLNSQDEPLLHPIKTALAWAITDGTGGFAVGNLVDPIMHAKIIRNETHDDEEVYQRLEDIRRQWLTPYYENLKTEGKEKALRKDQTRKTR